MGKTCESVEKAECVQAENTVSKDTNVEACVGTEVIEAEKGLDDGNEGSQSGVCDGGTSSVANGATPDTTCAPIGTTDKVTGGDNVSTSMLKSTDNSNGVSKSSFANIVGNNKASDMCRLGVGRVGYARVLVEVSAKKCLPELIEVVYRDREKVEICRKVVKVVIEWVPPRCAECCISGHIDERCGKQTFKEKSEVIEIENEHGKGKKSDATQNDSVGFKEEVQQENASKEQVPVEKELPAKETASTSAQSERNQSPIGKNGQGRAWNVQGEILEAIKRSTNNYAILDPDKTESNNACGVENINNGSQSEVNDVYRDENGIAQCMESDVVVGRDKEVLTYDIDSHDHLFFNCSYTSELWAKVMHKLKMHNSNTKWEEVIVSFVECYNGSSLGSITRRLCLAASVYMVWHERNKRLFKDERRSVEDLFKCFCVTIRMRLATLKMKYSKAVSDTEKVWDIKLNVISGKGS
ncbi:hypothetical protein CTI12_AA251010 [Artemisia annua]|uniref:Reverse transcriptase domain, Reverse transcriptase zinc-binding domain protein n=1 Tax=Artemisia annua TaxID=35608 RepID=A0A2U1NML7_ARTAN|nr:hypothetical protein CTI12_AA251010 [Artemisia annua]